MSSKKNETVTKDPSRPALVPKLRFPEFEGAGEWEERLLKDVAGINPANNGLPSAFVYIDLESVEAGKLQARNHVMRDLAPSRAQRLIEDGDIIFQVVRPYQRNNLLCEFVDSEAYVASTGYAQLRAKESNQFLFQSIHTDSFVDRVMKKCTGSNYPAISSSDLAIVPVVMPPSIPEQQRIASCLSSLDELITAQSRKVEALKTHKKGLMQQLFPREGETQPRLRFPEFEGEWEVRFGSELFSQISERNPGTDLPVLAITQEHGAIPRSMIDYHVSVTESSLDTYKLVREGDFIISLRSFQGGIEYSQYQGVCSPAYVILRRSCQGIDDYYRQYLKTDRFISILTRNLEGLRDGKMISYKQFSELPLPVPTLPEQQRIADCLSSLDELITTESNKLETYKTHKKGLMQGLFPKVEEGAS